MELFEMIENRLNEKYWNIKGSEDCAFYDGMVEAFEFCGFKIIKEHCGNSIVHIVKEM